MSHNIITTTLMATVLLLFPAMCHFLVVKTDHLGWALLLLPLLILLPRMINVLKTSRQNTTKATISFVVLFIYIIISMRLVLFYNPPIWRFYNTISQKSDLTVWQHRFIQVWSRVMASPAKNFQYMAFGSSQTRALFVNSEGKKDAVHVLHLPGLKPWEYNFYQKYIKKFRPEHILLNISEADLAANFANFKVKTQPNQWFYFIKLAYVLWEEGHPVNRLLPGLIAYFLPEYKYAFLFRSLVREYLGFENESIAQKEHISGEERYKRQYRSLTKGLKEKNIQLNIRLFTEFILFCQREKINLVIIEGQYNPMAYTTKNRRLNQLVVKTLENCANKFSHVMFIPKTEVYQFDASMYKENDATHVTMESGTIYVKSVFSYLKTIDYPNSFLPSSN